MENNNDNKVLNVPHLRFPEFSGEWKKHSLGEIGETIIGLTYKPSDVVDNNGIIVFRSSNIKNGMIDYSDLVRVNKHIKDKIITKENDILVCARNGSQRLIGKNAIIKQEDANNTFGAFMMVYRANDNPFILPLLSTKKYFSQVGENLGARINQITTSDFNGFEFYFPENHAERTKIAELFRLLDERIATQNKIIEDLKKLKSAIIEKTFNENYSNKIRLRDVGSYIRGLTYSSDDVVESNGIFVMRSNNIINGSSLDYHNNIVSVNKQILTEQQLQTGDIVICMANGSSSLVGKSSFYDGDCSTPITVGAFCGIYRSKEPIVKWLFQTNKYRRYIWNSLQGGNGAIANLNGDDILRMSFSIPATPAKDNRIKLLTSVDTLLESNISLCDLYISQKLYLLRQMFI